MGYTSEPLGLRWLNNINPSALGVVVSQACWFIGSVWFTWTASTLMLRQDGPSLLNGIPADHSSHRQLGFLLAGALLAAWTGKTAANVVDQQLKRKEYAKTAAIVASTSEYPVSRRGGE